MDSLDEASLEADVSVYWVEISIGNRVEISGDGGNIEVSRASIV